MNPELKIAFRKTIISEQHHEQRFYEDLNVVGIYITPFTKLSFVNLTQNQVILSEYDNHTLTNSLDWLMKQEPDKRFYRINFKIKRGDLIRFKIRNYLRGANDVIIMFLVEKETKNVRHNNLHKRRFKKGRH